ncbi:transmembrane protein 170B isoform X2 [Meriones unguiculatus]|uniref:transmembrane protein 170B isoform X2 n=1 Tax=Meriones unguiculatus TaxID=10047 RepID=UPI00293ED964|nr:transmembrane protein 170B isoform X2 [Meriones unguiculatus]
MRAEGADHSMINLSVQQVLSLWAHGTVLRNLTEMWYWIFLWALFSSLFVHGAAGVLMFVMLQRHRQGRVISVIAVSIGFLASVTGAMITICHSLDLKQGPRPRSSSWGPRRIIWKETEVSAKCSSKASQKV